MDRALWISFFLLLLSMAVKYNCPDPTYRNRKFAYEYGNIAESVVSGKGFANPFPVETGPTAWMPPFYVYLMAAVFQVCGTKSALSLWVLLVLKFLGLSASLFLLLRTVVQAGYGKSRYWMVPLFLAYVFAYRWQFFEELHDIWLTLVLACWLLYGLTSLATSSSRSGNISLFVLSFIVPLTSPALGLSLLFVMVVWIPVALRRATGKKGAERTGGGRGIAQRQARVLFSALGILACSVCFWTARNYVVFGRLIPVKSNLWFDFYQANHFVPDGIVSCSTFMNYHPINLAPEIMRHFGGGEQAFVEHYREASMAALRKDFGRVLRNVLRRAVSAFLLGDVYLDVVMVEKSGLCASDVEKLRRSSLVFQDPVAGSVHWTSLDLSKEDFRSAVRHLHLAHMDQVVEKWEKARARYAAYRTGLRTMVKRLLCTFVPALCILLCLVFKETRESPLFLLASAIYLVYLVPYVIVSHYSRYQQGLIGLIVLFLFLALHVLYGLVFGGKSSIESRPREKRP